MTQAQHIEGYVILLKNQKAKAVQDIIERVLGDKEIYVFGEFIELANVKEVSSVPFCNKTPGSLERQITTLRL